MTENQTKKIIQIFQAAQSNSSSAGCGPGDAGTGGCGPGDADTFGGCSCGPPLAGLEEMLTQFSRRHGDMAEVQLADYSSDEVLSETLDALNQVLAESNENLRVTMDNLELVLTQSAPIIAVGDLSERASGRAHVFKRCNDLHIAKVAS
jgi:hypothetical protein